MNRSTVTHHVGWAVPTRSHVVVVGTAHPTSCVRLNKCDRRGGFTLLEVLLAVGISMLAMAAVYAAMGIHLRFIEAGDNDVERAQLARAVLGRIAEDLRATVFRRTGFLSFLNAGAY